MRWLWGLVLLLGACATPDAIAPEGFRDVNVAITSSTRFDPARFAGDWFVIEDFTSSTNTPEIEELLRETFGPLKWVFSALGGNEIGVARPGSDPPMIQTYTETGFGQLTQKRGPFMSEVFKVPPVWVLWVDEDFRTAVLGTPDGGFGAIINRTPNLRADRLLAARDVLAFNGYDISKLRRVAQ